MQNSPILQPSISETCRAIEVRGVAFRDSIGETCGAGGCFAAIVASARSLVNVRPVEEISKENGVRNIEEDGKTDSKGIRLASLILQERLRC